MIIPRLNIKIVKCETFQSNVNLHFCNLTRILYNSKSFIRVLVYSVQVVHCKQYGKTSFKLLQKYMVNMFLNFPKMSNLHISILIDLHATSFLAKIHTHQFEASGEYCKIQSLH